MNIPVQFLQGEGRFSVPGTSRTVNGEIVRRAVGRLSLRERREAFGCIAGGAAPSAPVAEALRRAIVAVAEEQRERDVPETGASRSLSE